MATAAGSTIDESSQQQLFEQVEQYDWDNDTEFQDGLRAILESSPSSEQAPELTLRARCFFFTRKFNVPIDFDAYRSWRERSRHARTPSVSPAATNGTNSHQSGREKLQEESSAPPAQSVATTSQVDAPYPTSFAQIVELISTGQPIPGIKEVPDTVLDGQSSESTKQKRRKPWEKDVPAVTEGVASLRHE